MEGIFVRGDDDLVLQGGCWVSQRCGDNNCRGEDVTRSSEFQHLVPPDLESVIYEVWFGPCGELVKVGETRATSWEIRERLDGATPYCWRIVARNECGRAFGPTWSFITSSAIDPVFRRGDVNQDELVNLSDGIGILNYLFRQGTTPGCVNGADVDDSGQVNITDGMDGLASGLALSIGVTSWSIRSYFPSTSRLRPSFAAASTSSGSSLT